MLRNVRKFTWVTPEYDRNAEWAGWLMQGQEGNFDPMFEGYGVAHDVLEHFTDHDSGIEDEMMAFGSIFYIRVDGGYSFNGYSGLKNLLYEIVTFLAENSFKIRPLHGCRINETVRDNTLALFDHDDIQGVLRDELDLRCLPPTVTLSDAHNALLHALRWVSKGYAKAKRRFGSWHSYHALGLFQGIADKVDHYREFAEAGDILTIRWCNKTLDFKVEWDTDSKYNDW